MFSPVFERLVELALTEDLCAGDATTDALFDARDQGRAVLVAKAPLVLAGGPVFSYVMQRVARLPGPPAEQPRVTFEVADQEIDWFDLEVVVNVEGMDLSQDEIRALVAARGDFVRMDRGGWLRIWRVKLCTARSAGCSRVSISSVTAW